jgi:Fic family protein
MNIKDLYKNIDELLAKFKTLQPLKPTDEDRLWKKFRLDWNYNSNHIEGNTLTYGHTELLLFFDQVTGDYTGREIEEMKAHDVTIRMVVEEAHDQERELSEAFIRQLNTILLVRPFWKEALTNDGQPTRREITPGLYKQFTNSVRLQNGETFQYATPEETPALMHDLLENYKVNSKSTEVNPLWLAAMLHYDFVRIHPFDDGNGRIARLLMNYVLIKKGLPPVIIKDSDKKQYLAALNKADVGNKEAFVVYIGEQLIWSLNKSILAAEGKEISDPEDLDKEIAQLKLELGQDNVLNQTATVESIALAMEDNLFPLFELVEQKMSSLKEFFFDFDKLIQVQDPRNSGLGTIGTKNTSISEIRRTWITGNVRVHKVRIQKLNFRYSLNGFKKTVNGYTISFDIAIQFNEYNYSIKPGLNMPHQSFPYGKKLSETQLIDLITPEIKKIIEQIKSYK